MADNTPTGPVETGAEMDYEQHEKTYDMFIALSKYGTLFCVALLVAMAFGFYGGGGLIFSTLLMIILIALGAYFL